MRKIVNYLSIAIFLVGIIPLTGFTQDAGKKESLSELASYKQNTHSIAIKDALSLLENHYDVIFLYDSQFLKNKKVRYEKPLPSNALDAASHLLRGYNMRVVQLNNHSYAILPKGQTTQTALESIEVEGTVTDASTGDTLPGVNIRLKGTTRGTTTDDKGHYSLTASSEADTLIFSFIGYQSQTIPINGRNVINVGLESKAISGEEMVVVGYAQQKKENLTGSVSAVKSSQVESKPVGQLSAAMEGVAPGVTVTQSSGQPGEDGGQIRIRGVGTLNDSDPLILVDGVPFNSLNDIDANNIKSISVLKDASAASIYGVKAANGVILVTTKNGTPGKTKVSYSDYFGWQKPTRLTDFVGAQEYMRLSNELYKNSGSGAVFSQSDINAYDNPDRNKNKYPDNYWLGKILTGNGFQQKHDIAISGGNEKTTYRFSTGYFDQKGLIQNMDFSRLTVRLNTDMEVSDKFDVSANLFTRLNRQTVPQDNGAGSSWFQFGQAAVMNPTIVNRYSDGTWGIGRGDGNPIRLQEEGGTKEFNSNMFSGKINASYNLLKNLEISGKASANYVSQYNSIHDKALTYYNFFTTSHKVLGVQGQNDITKQYNGHWLKNFNGIVRYNKDLGPHSFKLMVGVSRRTESTNYLEGYRRGLPNSQLNQINAGSEDGQTTSGYTSDYALVSLFGRLNYDYKNKYLFEANLRRDGSSRFPKDHKWGIFPSFSVGWRISSEPFMQQVDFISNLKIRGSWGVLGNDAIGNYPYQSTYSFDHSYPFGGSLQTASYISTLSNSSLTWETTEMTDVGMDVSFLENKINFSFDYYVKNTNDILLQLPIPETVGLNPAYQNAGGVRNIGWEMNANYRGNVGDDFQYSIGLNLSDVRNKITDMHGAGYTQATDNNPGVVTSAYLEGLPIGAYYGYQAEGIFQNQKQLNSHATQPGNVGLGDLMYKDQNGDGVINADDRVFLGTDIPRYTYGINLGANYKNFDFSALLQGVGKVSINTVVMRRAPVSTDGNFKPIHEDSWTPNNKDASFPRLVTSGQNYLSSSFWVNSGAYLRVKNVQLGYTLPTGIGNQMGFDRLRVYVTGQNLLTFSKLPHDIDPEAPNENRYYPQVKTYTVGLNIQF